MMRRALVVAAILVGIPAAAGQTPPAGMVASPCEGLMPQIPEPVKAYIGVISGLVQTATIPPPPPELAAYRQANLDARKSDWADLCRYRADNARLLALPASARRIVFMGDSITQNWGLDDPGFFSGGIVNRGISGQTTPQMLLRFQADIVALKPKLVHIMAGTNDIAGNSGPNAPEDYKNNIRAMVTLAKANGIKVILASIPPAARFAWKPELQPAPRVAELNMWLKAYAKAEKVEYLDYHSSLTTPDGALQPAFTFDGIHPNHAGYQVMVSLARRAVAGR
ncbi:MAG: SGNH/GDSL hydrolase family protein [Sphingopyxis sp.]|nr:SGNH/GDSL hydrolase family protein [Sphingopyxis sp.]